MNGDRKSKRAHYTFGPFRLSLPPGWAGAFEDGVHTIASDAHDAAIQISGFERDAPVTTSDLYGMVPEGADKLGRFTLSSSGLDGFSWYDAELEIHMQVIRAGTSVLAISIIGSGDEDKDVVAEILGSLALNEEVTT